MSASDDPYSAYLAIRGEYDRSPSFYLECAEFFKAKGDLVKAVRVLSNLAEMDLEAPQVLRVLGYRLLQYDNPVESVPVFEVVLKQRPEEPQSYRDLAIALTRRAEISADTAKDDYSRALDMYQTLIWGRDYENWDGRFGDVELFALEESNAMLEAAKKAGVTEIPLDKEFIRPVDVDVRIVMTWSADNTDIDLWVIEPSGEKVFYGHKLSAAGGMISRDFTGGYGPEEYMIHNAPKGKYKIKAHYYASRAVELLGAVTVQADVYTNYGRPNQKRQSLTFPLKEDGKDVYDIGAITFEK
jgi:tetratricopeptide (TPR) repeat protein